MLVTADKKMVPELKSLWKTAFGDSDGYIANFFENAYVPERTMVAVKEGRVAGAAYLFPCEIGGKRASYLYAGAVFPEFRRQGIYEKMMHAWADWCIERDIIPFLKPADDKLWDYYERIGFSEFIGGKRISIENGGQDKCAISKIDADEFVRLRDEQYIKWQHMDYILKENEICGGDCVMVECEKGKFAMVYAVVEEVLYVRGFAGDIEVLRSCAVDLMHRLNAKRISAVTAGNDMRITAAVGAKRVSDMAADLLMD